jgi:hypothetical protein
MGIEGVRKIADCLCGHHHGTAKGTDRKRIRCPVKTCWCWQIEEDCGDELGNPCVECGCSLVHSGSCGTGYRYHLHTEHVS